MRNGSCPKCSSLEVYVSYAKSSLDAGLRAGDGQLLLNMHQDKGGLFGDKFNMLYFDCYLCQTCGYIENYVHDLSELSAIPMCKNWQKNS